MTNSKTPQQFRRALAAAVLAAMAVVLIVGCRLGTPKIAASPHGYDEQVHAILNLAPVGSERADVIRRLETAGIRGSFGVSQSTYYCAV